MVRLSDHLKYRLLEILPGGLAWGTIAAAIVLSFIAPVAAIIFIVLFDLYWLVRILYSLTYVILAWRRFRAAGRVDWLSQVRQLAGWDQLYHLIIIPTYQESLTILEATFASLSTIAYPLDHVIVVLATEERDQAQARANAAALQERYGQTFRALLISEHPSNIPGEVAGKGSNSAWAGRQAKEYIDHQQLPYENIIVSTFDADSVAHAQYFAYLAYTWLNHPDRHHTSYQPIPVFHNNIWQAQAPMRVVAYSTTFWMLGETMRPDRLFTFSSHSMPWSALVDVDFWQTDVVSEDSRIFLQCFLRYDGRYSVTPMYIPISMDTVSGRTWWRGWINQYKQIRRWAYGAENFPYMVWNFVRNPHLARSKKIKYSWYQFEGGFSWATAPILIIILGFLPFHAQPDLIKTSVLAQNAPPLIRILMSLALIGMASSAFLSTTLLPPRPKHTQGYVWLVMVMQWFFLPVTMIVFGSLPAMEAQSRLLLGRYLGFWVTEKPR